MITAYPKVDFFKSAESGNRTYRYTKRWYVAMFVAGKFSPPSTQCDSEAAAKAQAEQWERDYS